MRVAVVCLHTDPFAAPGSGDVGGMNVVVRHTCAALAARGVELTVVTRLTDPAAPRTETIDGVDVRRLEVGPARVVPKGENEQFIDAFAEGLGALTESGELEPFDLYHSHHWFSGMAALPVARATAAPHVQSFHSIAAPPETDLGEGERPESPGRLAGEVLLAQSSDAVVAVSHAEARTVVQRLGADPDRVTVVHPGVDTNRFRPRRPSDGPVLARGAERAVERPSLVVAARLEPLKGVDLAIEALALLPAPRPVLRVAGGATSDAAYVTSLVDLAARRGVAGDLELLGPLSRCDLARLLRTATLVLVPSHSETYGLVALEASASGVPVVAGLAGGLVEAVQAGRTGVLIGSRDPSEWAGEIGTLLEDPAERARLGGGGRRLALSRRWDRVARAQLARYEVILANGSSETA